MDDGLPPLNIDFNAAGTPVVIVDGQEVRDVSSLIDLAPKVVEPKYARAYARLVNHLSHGYQFKVIMDPDAFRDSYVTRYEAEDPEENTVSGQVRLRNYGLPDFSAIKPPGFEGNTLVFFAENAYLGVPYRVEVGTAVTTMGKASYELLPMTKD